MIDRMLSESFASVNIDDEILRWVNWTGWTGIFDDETARERSCGLVRHRLIHRR